MTSNGYSVGRISGAENVSGLLRTFIVALPPLNAVEQDVIASGDAPRRERYSTRRPARYPCLRQTGGCGRYLPHRRRRQISKEWAFRRNGVLRKPGATFGHREHSGERAAAASASRS